MQELSIFQSLKIASRFSISCVSNWVEICFKRRIMLVILMDYR